MIAGFSTLHLAARNSQPECLKRLLQVNKKKRRRKFQSLNLVGLVLICDSYICNRSDWQLIALTALVERRYTMQVAALIIDPPQHILKPLPSKCCRGAQMKGDFDASTQCHTVYNRYYPLQLSVAVCPALRSCGTLMPIWMSRTG